MRPPDERLYLKINCLLISNQMQLPDDERKVNIVYGT